MKRLYTCFWQHSLIALLCCATATVPVATMTLTGCTTAQVIKVESEITRFSPLLLNVLALACDIAVNPLCSTAAGDLSTIISQLQAQLQTYQTNLANGTATNADWNALNALFETFEQQSTAILNLFHVNSAKATTEALAIFNSANTLLAVIEAIWPGAPTTPTAMADVLLYARLSRFSQYMPSGQAFSPNAPPSQQRAEAQWLRSFFKAYNKQVDAAKVVHPHVKLGHVKTGLL